MWKEFLWNFPPKIFLHRGCGKMKNIPQAGVDKKPLILLDLRQFST